jgi:aryl-alcohol dehydrogenase-like predicted oxidoreductase/spore coat polysaccharide biosynthesis protein SpsF (cytidylyltransferase family)
MSCWRKKFNALPATRLVLQARFNSTRLPGKALLPIGEWPMVVLAAERAMRDGADLVVATSGDRSDDAIAEVCAAAGVAVFRGPLENVYERFIGATADLEDDATVVRLTADNVIPDAKFIQNIVDRLHALNATYLSPRWPDDGLPYGVMAEAFRVGDLRNARPESQDDAEHVTPTLRRKAGNPGFSAGTSLSHLRATVDTPDDYSRVCQVFRGQADLVEIGWRQLCDDLQKLPIPRAPWIHKAGRFQSQLTLGSAQLGMRYGVANAGGMPSADEVTGIVHGAIDHGVTHIDTAQLYGESESRIGMALAGGWRSRVEIITKLRPIATEDAGAARLETEQNVMRSLRALRGDHIETLLLHRAANRGTAHGAVWETLLDLRRKGLLGRLGISVQDRAEFDRAASDPDVELIQLPFNLLDRRWENLAVPRDNLTIHARSVFLQGLLTGVPASQWPVVAGLDTAGLIGKFDDLACELGRRGVADLAVAFVRAQSWIDSLVIGVDTAAQLSDNLERFATAPLAPEDVETVKRRLPVLPDQLLNPAQWRFQ